MSCDTAVNEKPITVMLCGVGGQGTITAADLLARAAMNDGYDVKVSEIHGMAQRGGAVSTTVRFGKNVSSMVCDPAQADIIISFELLEAVRNAHYLKNDGHIIVNDIQIKPMSVLTGQAKMPQGIHEALKQLGEHSVDIFDAEAVAREAGNPKTANVALLGAAAKFLPLSEKAWEKSIESRVPPKTLEANLAAFRAMYNKLNA